MQDGKRWIYYKGRRILVNDKGNIKKNKLLDNDGNIIKNDFIKDEQIEAYKNFINKKWENMQNYKDLENLQEHYFNNLKMSPIIKPKNKFNQQVMTIKENNDKVVFYVLDYERGGQRKAESNINNFKKNYYIDTSNL